MEDKDDAGIESSTSTILFFCVSLTFPARQQRERALWMMNLLDLKLGSLKSFGPENINPDMFWIISNLAAYDSTHTCDLLQCCCTLPVYSGAGEVPLEPLSQSLSPFRLASRLGVAHPDGESGRLLERGQMMGQHIIHYTREQLINTWVINKKVLSYKNNGNQLCEVKQKEVDGVDGHKKTNSGSCSRIMKTTKADIR